MGKFIGLIVLIFLAFGSFSQEIKFFNQRPKKNISLGVGGEGGILSLNHEKLHLFSFKLMMSNKIGIGLTQDFSFQDPQNYFIALPANISFCFGKRRVLFEAGFGATVFLQINQPFYQFCFYPIIGYRWQPLKMNKIFFKIFAALPNKLNKSNISISDSEILFVPIGINIGKSF